MYKGTERREYKRIEKLYMARVRVKRNEGNETVSTGWDSVTLHNLSEGGAFFIYKKDLGIGTLLDLGIDAPKAMLNINCVGKVTRIKQFQPTSMFCIAIKFIDIGEQEKEMINTAVEKALEHDYQTYLKSL
ncbi:MAG: PilZ domain-containing protein [Candidatus Scalindua sediminis]